MFEDRYTIGVRVAASIDEARAAVTDALKAEGFGILTEIDLAATLRAKLGVEREPYLILGACNPSFANATTTLDPSIGALLPCNVVLRADAGATVVEVMDPRPVMALVGRPGVADTAAEVRERLVRAIHTVADVLPAEEASR